MIKFNDINWNEIKWHLELLERTQEETKAINFMWKEKLMEFGILSVGNFHGRCIFEHISCCGVYESISDIYGFLCVWEREKERELCVYFANLFFLFTTATIFPSPSTDLESTGTDTFNGSQVLARILSLEKVISISFILGS